MTKEEAFCNVVEKMRAYHDASIEAEDVWRKTRELRQVADTCYKALEVANQVLDQLLREEAGVVPVNSAGEVVKSA